MSHHILVVDDDSLVRRSLTFHLEQAGFRTSHAESAEAALEMAVHDTPDLILLDIALPGMDGLAALHRLRDMSGAAIIFVTARRRHLDEVMGLELGADDYVTKPFQIDVLLARIKATLRARSETRRSLAVETMQVGDLTVNPHTREVVVAGRAVDLSPREFDLLYALALAEGNVVRREELLSQVWGADYAGEPQVLYVHISWLREKIEENPREPARILTVHGVGYRLVPQKSNVRNVT